MKNDSLRLFSRSRLGNKWVFFLSFLLKNVNRPFSSSLVPLFQNESSEKPFI